MVEWAKSVRWPVGAPAKRPAKTPMRAKAPRKAK